MKNTPKVETYRLFAGNGRYIRKATRVTLEDGKVYRFLDLLPKREAIKAALKWAEEDAWLGGLRGPLNQEEHRL